MKGIFITLLVLSLSACSNSEKSTQASDSPQGSVVEEKEDPKKKKLSGFIDGFQWELKSGSAQRLGDVDGLPTVLVYLTPFEGLSCFDQNDLYNDTMPRLPYLVISGQEGITNQFVTVGNFKGQAKTTSTDNFDDPLVVVQVFKVDKDSVRGFFSFTKDASLSVQGSWAVPLCSKK